MPTKLTPSVNYAKVWLNDGKKYAHFLEKVAKTDAKPKKPNTQH